MPFLVLYYQDLGFSGTQIGLLTGIAPLVTLVGIPLWTNLADTTRKHRLILGIIILVGAASIFVLPFFNTFLPIFIAVILFSAFLGPVTAFVDNATMIMLEDSKDLYGRIRLGGAVGYGLAAALVGTLVQSFGLHYAFWSSAGFWLLALIVSQKLEFDSPDTNNATVHNHQKLSMDWRWILFLVLGFSGGLGIAVYNSYNFPYLRGIGTPESTMGLTIMVGNLAEIPILFFGNRLIRRFKPVGLLMLGIGVTGARLLLFGITDTIALVFVLQLINGLTFTAMWIAGVAYADRIAPAGMGTTAQGYFSAMVFGFGPAVGGFLGGAIAGGNGGGKGFS